jgi:hypothetical protein
MAYSYYYPATIRAVVTSVLAFFNDIHVHRLDDHGVLVKDLTIPIKFGPVDKSFQFRAEKEFGATYYISLPNITFALTNIQYDSDRAMGVNEIRTFYDDKIGLDNLNDFWTDVQPTPYDLTFSMQILTESMDDWCQIMENILPYFKPAVYLRVKEFSFLDIERDLQMTLSNVATDFLMEQGEEDKRYVNGSLDFTVKCVLYTPVKNAKIIKQIQSRYLAYDGDNYFQTSQYNTSAAIDSSAASVTSAYNNYGEIPISQVTSAGQTTSATWYQDMKNYFTGVSAFNPGD